MPPDTPTPPTHDEMCAALRYALSDAETDAKNFPESSADRTRVAALRAALEQLEANRWRPEILVGRVRPDGTTYYICPERPGFHFITAIGEGTDALLNTFREFLALCPPATASVGSEGA